MSLLQDPRRPYWVSVLSSASVFSGSQVLENAIGKNLQALLVWHSMLELAMPCEIIDLDSRAIKAYIKLFAKKTCGGER